MFLSIFLFISACEKKELKDPGVEVNGLWQGTWQTSDRSMSGTFICPLSQERNHLNGEVYIQLDLPDGDSYIETISGRVEDKKLSVVIDISGVQVDVHGVFKDDFTIDGNFFVSLGFEGVFSGEKIPIQNLNSSRIYQIGGTDNWYDKLLIVKGEFWIYDMMQGSFDAISKEGEYLSSHSYFDYSSTVTSDGAHIWTLGYDSETGELRILKLTIEGSIVGSYATSASNFFEMASTSENIFIADVEKRLIRKLDDKLQLSNSTLVPAIPLWNFICYKSSFILMLSAGDHLFQVSQAGGIEAVYTFDHLGDIRSIATDHAGRLWCLTEELEFRDNSSPLSNYYLYELVLDD